MDTVRIVRIMEYTGPRDAIEKTLDCGAVPANGIASHGSITIRSATLGSFAEILSISTTPIAEGL